MRFITAITLLLCFAALAYKAAEQERERKEAERMEAEQRVRDFQQRMKGGGNE